ncbi:signal peptidase II [Pseudenhygromyxa sp. WMMC2535]|uniref:signal peptidase II n=1 Tax=Pseudenhygromyxa sp. WMMC2535 TaxID=2712867 RepID=UPI0015570D86|nr:signal peptidase II [Pseudenhygromyxa sp. WMMC2535]NVB39742.1 signal peptidase II [Pseudenhygromyxa sp. WMMC2535]
MRPGLRRWLTAAWISGGIIAVDQLSKAWAFAHLRGGERRVLVPGVFEFDYAFNTGSAFGLFADRAGARAVLIALTLASVFYMVALLRRLPAETGAGGPVALAMMVGGALGNLVDRLLRFDDVRFFIAREGIPFRVMIDHPRALAEAVTRGRSFVDLPRHGVVDFIVVYYWPGRRWPSFNVADIFLVVGLGVFLIYLARNARSLIPPEADPPEAGEEAVS